MLTAANSVATEKFASKAEELIFDSRRKKADVPPSSAGTVWRVLGVHILELLSLHLCVD